MDRRPHPDRWIRCSKAATPKILVGVALVYIAGRRWRKMGQPKPPKKAPKWQTGIDNMSPLVRLARTKTWIDTHTDQVIIIVSSVLGL